MFKNYSIRQSILNPTILIILISLLTASVLTYINLTSATTEIVENSSKEINKQVILNFENYISSVRDTADYIQDKTIEYGLRNNNFNLDDVYRQASEVQGDIESIVLISIAGEVIATSTNKEITYADLTLKEWYQDAINEDAIYHFSSPHNQDIFRQSNAEVITVTKMVDYYHNTKKYRGILIVDINTSNIVTLTKTTNLGKSGHIVILNDDDSFIYSNKSGCYNNECDSLDIAKEIIFGGQSVKIDDNNMYANVNSLGGTRWRMATFVNTDIIQETQTSNLIVLAVIILSTVSVTLLILSYTSRKITSPINKLKDHMLLVEQGDFYRQIEIEGQKEVVMLTHSFNSMIEEIRELMDRIIVEQGEKRKTEFQALQNQINPHFLYNTLDSIVYLAENKMNDKVISMVVALSKFFRISISRGKNIINLKEELEHARNYLLIQKIRYNEKFDFEFVINEDVLDLKVVKLSLQPLIENAIHHGISTEYGTGHIIIRAFKNEDKLILEVEDDGYGITEERIEELYQSIKYNAEQKSVGLRNVYQRLKIYYGDEADFIIDSDLDEKTVIRLIIPLERAK